MATHVLAKNVKNFLLSEWGRFPFKYVLRSNQTPFAWSNGLAMETHEWIGLQFPKPPAPLPTFSFPLTSIRGLSEFWKSFLAQWERRRKQSPSPSEPWSVECNVTMLHGTANGVCVANTEFKSPEYFMFLNTFLIRANLKPLDCSLPP